MPLRCPRGLHKLFHVGVHLLPAEPGPLPDGQLAALLELLPPRLLGPELAEAAVEPLDLLLAHGLVLVELAEAGNHLHHLAHAGLVLVLLGRPEAHVPLEGEGGALDEGHLGVGDVAAAVPPDADDVVGSPAEDGREPGGGRQRLVHHP